MAKYILDGVVIILVDVCGPEKMMAAGSFATLMSLAISAMIIASRCALSIAFSWE
jgi:hypothetical protein